MYLKSRQKKNDLDIEKRTVIEKQYRTGYNWGQNTMITISIKIRCTFVL